MPINKAFLAIFTPSIFTNFVLSDRSFRILQGFQNSVIFY